MFERKKVGVALGGGGARGMAHIGVLKVLEENKIPIDFISGTSCGALIAALYAAEPNAKKLEKEMSKEEWNKIFDYTIPRCGIIKGEKIENLLEERLNSVDFKDLKIPLFVTSFDIENKKEIIFHRGNVAKAVRASISIPGLFVPVENNNRILVDGAVTDPIPTEILKKQGADIVIAVNVNKMKLRPPSINEKAVKKKGSRKMPGIIYSMSKSFQITGSEAARADLALDHADLVIGINIENIGLFEFNKSAEAIKAGEKSARRSLNEIKKLAAPNPFKEFLDELHENLNVKKIVKNIKKLKKELNK